VQLNAANEPAPTVGQRARHLVEAPPPSAPSRSIRGALRRLKTTFDEGESLWTPVVLYLGGWALALPAFLFMIAVSFATYYLAGGE